MILNMNQMMPKHTKKKGTVPAIKASMDTLSIPFGQF
jgi:hypothetical protein